MLINVEGVNFQQMLFSSLPPSTLHHGFFPPHESNRFELTLNKMLLLYYF